MEIVITGSAAIISAQNIFPGTLFTGKIRCNLDKLFFRTENRVLSLENPEKFWYIDVEVSGYAPVKKVTVEI
jgi:hypothetical protein